MQRERGAVFGTYDRPSTAFRYTGHTSVPSQYSHSLFGTPCPFVFHNLLPCWIHIYELILNNEGLWIVSYRNTHLYNKPKTLTTGSITKIHKLHVFHFVIWISINQDSTEPPYEVDWFGDMIKSSYSLILESADNVNKVTPINKYVKTCSLYLLAIFCRFVQTSIHCVEEVWSWAMVECNKFIYFSIVLRC